MEEIAGFEDRLAGLKERGEDLVEGCSERVQSRLRQQVQAQQQGTRDSYSAICSTAQRVSTAGGGTLRRPSIQIIMRQIYIILCTDYNTHQHSLSINTAVAQPLT